MTIWHSNIRERAGPLYLAIAHTIQEAVGDGRLRSGEQLPPQRDLAARLGVALTTVTRGYAEAERRGWVTGEVGRGTFVAPGAEPPGADDSADIDLTVNALLPHALGRELTRSMGQILAEADAFDVLDYESPRGAERHRAAGAEWIRRSGLDAHTDRVLLTNGAQHAMAVSCATLTNPGDTVLTEALTYSGMKSLAHHLHLRLHGVALDHEGLRPDALDAACATTGATVLYTMPTLHNPTTAVMSASRRQEIATVAVARGLRIIEDDSYGFLLPDLRPLSAYVPEAFYLTGTAKSLTAGLRIGFLLAPPAMIDRLEAAICSTIFNAPAPMAEVVTRWLGDGTADRIVEWKRAEVAARQTMAKNALGRFAYHAHALSQHGWLDLPEPWCAGDFVEQARMRGVLVSAADDYIAGRAPAPHSVRICLGSTPHRDRLQTGLDRLASILEAPPEPTKAVV